jgi:serine/threonine-protein kinase
LIWVVRRVTQDGFVSTWVGNGTGVGTEGSLEDSTLSAPHGVAMDSKGNAYIAESCRIRKVTPSPKSIISTVAGTVPGMAEGDALTQVLSLIFTSVFFSLLHCILCYC